MRRNAAILFIGDARRDEAQKGLPPRFLERLHDELAAIIRSTNDVDLYLASDRGAAFLIDGPRFTVSGPQRSLGEKVDDALTSCFAAGYERVAVVAGDVAGLTRELLADAFAKTQPALGESPDGGFYLAAFSAPPGVDWAALPWSTAEVHSFLFAQLGDVYVLPPLRDIDSFGDALTAIAEVTDTHTRAVLHSLLLGRAPVQAKRPLCLQRVVRPTNRPRPPPAL
jgi:glycosyltransferase A (GT-A) superfamily protein (DUF2064 family)